MTKRDERPKDRMRQVMEQMMAEMKDLGPMAMCQAMMASASKCAKAGACATPEARALFEECARSVEPSDEA